MRFLRHKLFTDIRQMAPPYCGF